MGTFKEINKADGSGTTLFYRASYANTFDISDLDIDTESVLYRTGLEISQMTEDKPAIVLCTEDYIYTDQYGSLMSVERGTIYEMDHGTIVDTIAIGGGGGGGGTPRSNLTTAISPLEQNVSIKATVKLAYHFLTTAINKTGTAKLYVNNVLKSTTQVTSGEDYEFNVTPYLKLGTNYFTIRTADDNGAEKILDFLVNGVQLVLTSNFSADLPMPNTFDYQYKITGTGTKIIHFVLDGEDTQVVTTSSGIDLTQHFENLSHGTHTLQVYATAELDGTSMISNSFDYSLLTYDPSSSDIIMLSNFNTLTCMEGEHLRIDYKVYDPANLVTTVRMYINEELVMTTTADRTQHVWNLSEYPTSTVTFKIECGEAYIEKVVEVEPISIEIHEATEGLELKLTTANRSNQETPETRSIWRYEDIIVQMNNFNWTSNGWIDNKLKLNGAANAVIPFQPFAEDLRRTGKTIEIAFTTHEPYKMDSVLLSCIDDDGIGFEVTMDSTKLASEQQMVSTRFGEENEIRVTFVVEPTGSNRLIKTYINGVLSGLRQYAMDDNFQQASPFDIIINPEQEEIDIACIRVYNRALTSREIVNNWIYDMTDISQKINTFNANEVYDFYGQISYAKVKNYLPVVIVTGALPTYKGDKKTVTISYENNTKEQYNFFYEGCKIDVQGTSSQYYPRKNWKITLPEKIQVNTGMLPEKVYCMKADFMESSHTYNIGTANLINDLYDGEYLYPTRTSENGVRDTVYGFPCVLFTREDDESDLTFAGTFMFNNDKADSDTLGFTTPESESWEFCNNTSDHCLFKSDDFSDGSGVEDNLEARYPDGNTDYTALQQVFQWVVSCTGNPTKFRNEFEQHFSLHYCLIYQVMMETAIMVDSRAKNMFLDTADGIIWYPRFYDMDTAWGLNNEGVPAWSYDVEIHDQVGSAYVWDDRGGSVFWNLFEEAFADEIKDMYCELRDTKLTYENIMHYYVDEISSQFSASEYNEDSEFKYVQPLTQQGNATYLYAAQGNRQDYFRWIVKNRLNYLDSKYEYGNYNSDYVTMRWYTKNGNITIKTHQTMYIKAKFGSSVVKQKIIRDVPTTIYAPAGLEFNDTEVIIWGASEITDLGDLTSKYPGTVDISHCSRLQTLILGSTATNNTNLVSISLGTVPMLKELYITNCPNLTGNLDMSGCVNLRMVMAKGTNITSFTLPEHPVIEEMHLPKSLTSLTLRNVNTLTELDVDGFYNIKSLIYENSTYSLNDLLAKCGGLTRMRIALSNDYSYMMDIDGFMYYYNSMMGIDEQGFNLPHPYITGTIVLQIQDYHTQDEIDTYQNLIAENYNLLSVRYETITSLYQTFMYAYKTTATYNNKYTYAGDGIFNYIALDGEDKNVVVTRYNSYSTPLSDVPANNEFVYLVLRTNGLPSRRIVFLPQTISGLPVMGYYIASGATSTSTNMDGIIIPRTYRMFDLDFYVEYNLINGFTSGGPSIALTKRTNQGTYLISNLNNVHCTNGSNAPLTPNLRSIVFGGTVNLIPCIKGNYLYTFLDTSKVIYTYPNVPYTTLSSPNKAPYWPLEYNNYHHVFVLQSNGSYLFENNEYFKLPQSVTIDGYTSGSGTFYLYKSYSGDLDLTLTTMENPRMQFAQGVTLYNINVGNNGAALSQLSLSVRFKKIFDASGITSFGTSDEKLGTMWYYFDATSSNNYQLFPDLQYLYMPYVGSGYLDVPNLRGMSTWSSGSSSHYDIKDTIPADRRLKIIGHTTNSYGSHIMGLDSMRNFACLVNGYDCSEFIFDNETGRSGSYTVNSQLSPIPDGFAGLFGFGQIGTLSNNNSIRLYLGNLGSHTDENLRQILINIFNTIADLSQLNRAGKNLLSIGSTYLSKLTAEDIAIATNKGWTVS